MARLKRNITDQKGAGRPEPQARETGGDQGLLPDRGRRERGCAGREAHGSRGWDASASQRGSHAPSLLGAPRLSPHAQGPPARPDSAVDRNTDPWPHRPPRNLGLFGDGQVRIYKGCREAPGRPGDRDSAVGRLPRGGVGMATLDSEGQPT